MVGMAQPGWYPGTDESGRPQYWDGDSWQDHAPEPSRSSWPRWWPLAVGLLILALVVAVMVLAPRGATPWGVNSDNNSAQPTGSQWNELIPSDPPTDPSEGGGRPVDCPIVEDGEGPAPKNGWFTSKGMTYQGVPGWESGGAWAIDFASDRSGQRDRVTSTWVAITAIGQLSRRDFHPQPQISAQQLIDCLSTSYYYVDLDRVEVLEDRAYTTADGVSGWMIRANFWNIAGTHAVLGDEVVVLVLDNGHPNTLTLFHTQAPIGDEDRKAKVRACLESLRRE